MKSLYSILIQWSKEDQCYVVSIPEFTDYYQPVTHGDTYEEALEMMLEDNIALPTPNFFSTNLP